MKRTSLLIFLILTYCNCVGQNLSLTIKSESDTENRIIDSLNYNRKVNSEKKMIEEVNSFVEKIQKIGFLEAKITEKQKINDTTFLYLLSLNQKKRFIHIYIGEKNKQLLDLDIDTLKIDFNKTNTFLEETLKKIEKKGHSISKVKLTNISIISKTTIADLSIDLDKKRAVNDIVISGYDKFPKGYKKNLLRKYKNKVFNRESLERISSDFKSIRFIKQTKYPEILFNSDTTKIYAYIEKKKNNYFDGFLGFTNSEEKLVLNGYLDLSLNNTLNTGDIFSIKWRSDGKDQKNFNLGVELPYVFNSPIGLKLQLNIFRQDSTFQNSKTDIEIGYYLNNKSKIYLGYQSTESSDIGNLNSNILNDFNNYFITSSFDKIDIRDDALFPEKSNLNFKIGYGERESKLTKNPQLMGSLNLSYSFDLSKKNSLYVSSHNYYLQSDTYLTNELYRFGGIKSIRGYRENSLQGNQISLLLSEYRYRFSDNFYMHSILDYGYYKDSTTNLSNRPLGFGLGLGLLNTSGMFNLIYANGIDNNQVVKLSNSIIHISFKSYF